MSDTVRTVMRRAFGAAIASLSPKGISDSAAALSLTLRTALIPASERERWERETLEGIASVLEGHATELEGDGHDPPRCDEVMWLEDTTGMVSVVEIGPDAFRAFAAWLRREAMLSPPEDE